MATAGYALLCPGESNMPVMSAGPINLLALGQTLVIPARTGLRFIARAAFLRILARTGTVSVAPVVRVGNNGTFNNVCTVTTLTAANANVETVFPLTLANPLVSASVSSTGISIDVSTAGTGATVLTGQVYLQGLFVS